MSIKTFKRILKNLLPNLKPLKNNKYEFQCSAMNINLLENYIYTYINIFTIPIYRYHVYFKCCTLLQSLIMVNLLIINKKKCNPHNNYFSIFELHYIVQIGNQIYFLVCLRDCMLYLVLLIPK